MAGAACSQNRVEALDASETENEAEQIGSIMEDGNAAVRPESWREESHGNDVAPNYAVVFPDDKVNQLTITIAPEEWQAMQANMTELFGEPGAGGDGRGFPGGGFEGEPGQFPQPGENGFPQGFESPEGDLPPAGEDGFPEGLEPPADDERPAAPGGFAPGQRGADNRGFGGGDMTPENPDWVPATIEFDGETWTNVGLRYKGNSSLTSGWRSGELKLPFKLDFDEF